MIQQLNPEQLAAVTTASQHTLVLAGAGSGKTKVLTTRMAWLIQNGKVSPYGVLAVTFTNKAAREMLTRLTAMLPVDTRGMWVGTFHGLCNRLLRAHYRDAGLPQNFQILDIADQLAAIKRLIKSNDIDDEKFPPRDVQRFINNAKENGERPEHIEIWDAHRKRLAEIYQLYQEQCQREGVVDFAELLLRAYELLSRNTPVREHYQRRFRYILIDEFQDTNTLQYKWLCLLAGGDASLFAVGDDDQSIYAFRGANVGNMSAFERDYAGDNIIRLEQNYRSFGHILDAANALIEHNTERLGKNLWTDRGEGELLRVVEQPSDLLEAQWVVDEIRAQINEGRMRSEIAVLYRSNAQSRPIEHALFSAHIPYKVYGGLRFFERQEIKHVLAYLRLVASGDDDTSFMRVVNFPTRGIGARTLENLTDSARQIGCNLIHAVGAVSGRSGGKLLAFAKLIETLREAAQTLSLPELIKHVNDISGLTTHYEAEREGAERLENLGELINAATAFCVEENLEGKAAMALVERSVAPDDPDAPFAREQTTPLALFLSHASLEAGDNQAQAGEDAIQLMTIHAAKGLEFDSVFITGVEEGLFPHENSMMAEDGLQEERRLMYVAITRAKERLTISLAHSRMLHGQTRYSMRSRFLDELPEDHLKWLTPRAREQAEPSWGMRLHVDAHARPSTGKIEPRAPRSTSSGVSVSGKQYRIGQGVHHARFGDGTIIRLSGQGADAQAEIVFRDAGAKTLALAVAKLDIIAA
ncbi:DNA helicase II [Advenella sp. S44]|uniref:UvrD-helicase domain-containing protein n=1 Tax=Advenella sp. S44 TaxID=1982755 RepID=UPI000C2ABA87|nr:UvrD-helicase domain-containing protein [Advenella sp. S44]PJX23061.1 DNA helicase II [Advenella sp. S44]